MSDLPEPITREEMFLSAVAGESATLPAPVTREELFLAKAAGENVITPEPVTRREMFLDAIASGGGGGGGNPNYVETITGTLANPWGGNSSSELFTSARASDLTMYIKADVIYDDDESPYASTLMFLPISGIPTFGFTKPSSITTILYFARLSYSNAGSLTRAVAGNIKTSLGTQELHNIEPTTPCTLTIIHHPMPTSEG